MTNELPEGWVTVDDYAQPPLGGQASAWLTAVNNAQAAGLGTKKAKMVESVTTDAFMLKGDDVRYSNTGDLSRRLMETFVRFDGEYVYIRDINGKLDVYATRRDGSGFWCSSSDTRLDISSIPLGFIQYENSTLYAERQPYRQQTQGVQPARMTHYDIARKKTRMVDQGPELNEAYFKALAKEFPTLRDGFASGLKSFPFSRTWAISQMKTMSLLYYKTVPVGFFDRGKFILHSDYSTPFRVRSLQNILSKQYGEHYDIVY